MNSRIYTAKVSAHEQITLPLSPHKQLHGQLGNRVSKSISDDGALQVASKPPIAGYFGKLAGAWTDDGKDTAEYMRKVRNDTQPKV